ncbi:MAG: hypothetical protein ABJP70_05765 [Erythrobacter sp.]
MIRNVVKHAIGLATGLLLVAGSPVLAEEADAKDGYIQLANAVASDQVANLVFEKDMIDGFEAVLKEDTDVAALDTDCPGFIAGFTKAARPILYKSHMQDYAWYRGELSGLFRKTLSKEDAAGAAMFFTSEFGQKFLAQTIANQTFDNSIAEVLSSDTGEISEETYADDKTESVKNILSKLSESELQDLDATFRLASWFPAFFAIQPQIQALSLELTNKDFNEEDGAEFDAVTDSFIDQHLETCDAE